MFRKKKSNIPTGRMSKLRKAENIPLSGGIILPQGSRILPPGSRILPPLPLPLLDISHYYCLGIC